MGTIAQVDQYLTPMTSLMAAGSASPKLSAWQFGVEQGIQAKKIRTSTGIIGISSGTIGPGLSKYAVDKYGIVSNSNNFLNTSSNFSGLNQQFTGTAWVDLIGAQGTFSIQRNVTVQLLVNCIPFLVETPGIDTCDGEIALTVNGVPGYAPIFLAAGNDQLKTMVSYAIVPADGPQTITVHPQARLYTIYGGTPNLTINSFEWDYVILGT